MDTKRTFGTPALISERNHYQPVMVNCRCQFGWATGCLDSWENIILSVSVRLFLKEISICVKFTLIHGSGPHPICRGPEQHKDEEEEPIYSPIELKCPSSPALRHQCFWSRALRLRLGLTSSAPLVLMSSDLD